MSQKRLAERLDCNESYISKIEKGKSKPTLDFIFLLTKVFGVGIDDLLPFTPANSVIMKAEIQERWKKCSPEMTNFLNTVIDGAEQFEKDVENVGFSPDLMFNVISRCRIKYFVDLLELRQRKIEYFEPVWSYNYFDLTKLNADEFMGKVDKICKKWFAELPTVYNSLFDALFEIKK